MDDGSVEEFWVARLAAGEAAPLLNVGSSGQSQTEHLFEPAVAARLDALTRGEPVGLLLLVVAATRIALAGLHNGTRHIIMVPAPGRPAELALCTPIDRSAPATAFLNDLHRELESAVPLAWEDREAVAARLRLAGVSGGETLNRVGVTCAEAGYQFLGPVDLRLTVRRTDQGMALVADAPAGMSASAAAAVRCTATVLRSLANDPRRAIGTLDLLEPSQRRRLVEWSGLPAPAAFPDATLSGLVEAAAARVPDRDALATDEVTWNHRELSERSTRAARRLAVEHRVQAGDRVALLLTRSPELVVAVLAVLRAGASCVPLDPTHPPARLARQLRLSGAVCVIAAPEDVPADYEGPVASPHDLAHEVVAAPEVGTASEGEAMPGPAADDEAFLFFTSGSTGPPRPVSLTHRQVAHKVVASGQLVGFDEHCRCALLSAPSSDALTYQIFTTLAAGGCVVPVRSPQSLTAVEFWSHLRRLRVDVVNCVPSLLAAMTEGLPSGSRETLRICLLGGDEIPTGLLPRVADRIDIDTFVNLYGPTEATIEAISFICPGTELATLGLVPIGKPSVGFGVLVLTEHGEHAPPGVPGEIFILGPGVAAGYLDDAPTGPGRFVDVPGHHGVRAFRTGDFGRWTDDGELVFLGRRDDQLKINGNRIELGEIAVALRSVAGVDAAEVVASRDTSGSPAIGAVYTSADGLDAADVHERLARTLPGFMLPARIMRLDALPVTLHGKVDRTAILTRLASRDDEVWVPSDDIGRAVARIWTDVVGNPPRSADEDLFAAGGHSLTAALLAGRLCTDFADAQVTVRKVFAARTPGALAELLRHPIAPGVQRESPAGWPNDPHPVPATNAQRRLWFLELYQSGALRPYTMVEAFRLSGDRTAAEVVAALEKTVRRHQALRTIFDGTLDELQQIVLSPDQSRPNLTIHRAARGKATATLHRLARQEQRHRFDPAGPLMRAHWVTEDGEIGGTLLLCIHHSICDGWSYAVILRDLVRFLDGTERREEPTQYGAYSLDRHRRGTSRESIDFWRRTLADAPTTDLPLDRSRPAERDTAAGTVRLTIDKSTTRALTQLCRQLGATPFTAMVAAVRVLLLRWNRSNDVLLGTVMSGRDEPGLTDSVGLFADTVVMRTPVDPARGFAALVAAVSAHATDVRVHDDHPLDDLVDSLGIERVPGRNPLFDVLVEAVVSGMAPLGDGSPVVTHVPLDAGVSAFDLTFSFSEPGPEPDGTIEAAIAYRKDVLNADTAHRLAAQLATLLINLVADPAAPVGSVDVLPADQRTALLRAGAGDELPELPTDTLLTLVSRQVGRAPDNHAVIHDDRHLTYRELDRRADVLAAQIAEVAPTGPGRLVAVLCERSEWMPVSVLGVLKTGSAFLPLDPEQSELRIEAVLRDSGAIAVVVTAGLAARLRTPSLPVVVIDDPPAHHPVPQPTREHVTAGPTDLAYVVYTSGSTGEPKGVMVEHRGIVAAVLFRIGWYQLDSDSTTLQIDPLHADAGISDIFSALVAGAPMVVLSRGQLLTPAALASVARQHPIRHVQLVPSLYAMLLDEVGSAFRDVREVVLGGERATRALCDRHARLLPGVHLYNEYGPAEDSVLTTIERVLPESRPRPTTVSGDASIGRPLPGRFVDLVDEQGELVPWGSPGELSISGVGVARGYLGDPELTNARFVPSRVRAGTRTYRTGDLARRLPDGRLEFLGRSDDQLKIRGNRVEPNEVAAVLAEAPGVRAAAVLPRSGPDGDPSLVAYVVGEADVASLRNHLAARLPAYMMPDEFVRMDALPVSSIGKLDRRALPDPDDVEKSAAGSGTSAAGHNPFTTAEQQVADVFSQMLGRSVSDPDASLFDLGGHSLIAARIAHALGVSVTTVFTYPTVGLLAAARSTGPAAPSGVTSSERNAEEQAPTLQLSGAQRRVWLTSRWSGSGTFIIADLVRLGRRIDPDALRRALAAVVERQDMLRAQANRVGRDAELQVLDSLPDEVPLRIVELPDANPLGRQVAEALHQAGMVEFDLHRAPLFEVRLLSGVAGGDLLTVTAHHFIYDGASVDVLLRDLFTAYDLAVTGVEPRLSRLRFTYQDWIREERRWLAGPDAQHEVEFWRERLRDVPPGPDLGDPTRRGSRRGQAALARRTLPAAILRASSATPFAQVMTAFATTVQDRTGVTDLVIGFAAGLRDRPETDELIGYLVNAVALRVDGGSQIDKTTGDSPTADSLLPRVQAGIAEAYEHARLPFDVLVERLGLRARPGRSVLLDLGVSWENAGLQPGREAVEDLLVRDVPATSDLWLYASVKGTELHLDLTYDNQLLDQAEAEIYVDDIARNLAELASAPAPPAPAPSWGETRYDF